MPTDNAEVGGEEFLQPECCPFSKVSGNLGLFGFSMCQTLLSLTSVCVALSYVTGFVKRSLIHISNFDLKDI